MSALVAFTVLTVMCLWYFYYCENTNPDESRLCLIGYDFQKNASTLNIQQLLLWPTKRTFSNTMKATAVLWWKWNMHTCQEMSREIPVSRLRWKIEVILATRRRKHWKTQWQASSWMFLECDYSAENWGGQVEQCGLMCKGRIRHRVDPTGSLEQHACCLCVEELINRPHTICS